MGSDEDFRKRSRTPAYTPVRRVAPEHEPRDPGREGPGPGARHRRRSTRAATPRASSCSSSGSGCGPSVWLLGARLLDMPEPGDYVVHRDRPRVDPDRAPGGRRRARVLQRLPAPRQPPARLRRRHAAARRARSPAPTTTGNTSSTAPSGASPTSTPSRRGAAGAACASCTCDTWGGFVWYTLNRVAGAAARVPGSRCRKHLDPYNFNRMVQTRDITVEWHCNWKTSVDAFNESYHVQGIHPQLLWYLHDLDIQIDCYERHSRYLIPFGTLSPARAQAAGDPRARSRSS